MAYTLPNITDLDNYLLSRRYAEDSPTRRGANVQKQQDVIKALPALGLDGLPLQKEGMDGLGLTQEELISASPYTNINQFETPMLETPVASTVAAGSFDSPASPYMNVDLGNMGLTNPVYTPPPPINPFTPPPVPTSQYPHTANGYRNIGAVSGEVPSVLGKFTGKTVYPSGTNKVYNTPTGNIKFFQRGSAPGYMVKDGNKNKVTNNAMNVVYTKGSKLPAGAIGVLQSPNNGKDAADSFILAFESMEAGFANSRRLLSTSKYYDKNGGLNTAFQKWSHANYVWKGKQRVKNSNGSYKKSTEYKGKLAKLHKLGIDTSKNFTDLTDPQQQVFMEAMADSEGKWR